MVCWFLSRFSSPKSFHLIIRKFLSFRVFCRERNLMEITWYKIWWIWWRRAGQPKSNIFPSRFLLNVALHYHGEAQSLSYWRVWGVFFKFSCTCCSCWEYKSALYVWLQFKNANWLIPWWSYHTNCITYISWIIAFWGRLRRFGLFNSQPFRWRLS